ncbi:MAG: hypothetical protein ACP5VQ_10220 [Phycisphaerae bacterium]
MLLKSFHFSALAATVSALIATGSALVASTPPSPAMTIYADSFPGGSAAPLNGSRPATDLTRAKWIAGPDWKADGSIARKRAENAFLPFTPVIGGVYTLTVTASPDNNPNASHWLALGFVQNGQAVQSIQGFYSGTTTGGTAFGNIDAGPWMMQQPNATATTGGGGQYFTGPAIAGTNLGEPNGVLSPATISVVLNTTAAHWTAQWYVDGKAVGAKPFVYPTKPVITAVGFGGNGALGRVARFKLTGPAPAIAVGQYLTSYPQHTRLNISQLARWRKNISANADMLFFAPKGGGWGMKVAFHGGDPWAYPQFPLPAGIHAKRVVAVLLRARVASSAMVRLMVFNQGGIADYCTLSGPIIAADRKWHTVLVPLSRLDPVGKGPPITSLAGAKFISVGLNNDTATGINKLEVSNLYLVYRREPGR